jgi:hypothetical protein
MSPNVVPIPAGRASEQPGEVQRAGQAILSTLQEAADQAKLREARIRETVVRLEEGLRNSQGKVDAMEAALFASQARAEEAEQWLTRVFDEVTAMAEPSKGRAEGDLNEPSRARISR